MNNDTIIATFIGIGTFIGVMLSIIIIYLLTSFIWHVFCNNNNHDNCNRGGVIDTILNNCRIDCVPANIIRETNNSITIVVINDNVDNDNYYDIDNLPIAQLVK
jgi:hypothetical protein